METEQQTLEARARAPEGLRSRNLYGALKLVAVLYVFVGALQVVKTGAGALDVFHAGGFFVRNAGSTLGLGWIGAMLTLSGSTAAAAAAGLMATGAISATEGFTMVTGARLGAAFVVLLIAALYVIRRGTEGKRKATVSTGVMALVITAVIYLPGAVVGLAFLKGPGSHLDLSAPPSFGSLIDVLYGWALDPISSWPPWLLFVGGVGLLAVSFKVLDALVPEVDQTRFEGRVGALARKWPMFFLGFGVVIVTLSVSVALTVLVPLVAKGYVKREHLIPYIVGADIGTLIDKLLVAFVVGIGAPHPQVPVQVMIASIVGTAVVGLVVMTLLYRPFKRGVWRVQRAVTRNKVNLALFTGTLFVVPLAIIGLSGLAG